MTWKPSVLFPTDTLVDSVLLLDRNTAMPLALFFVTKLPLTWLPCDVATLIPKPTLARTVFPETTLRFE